MLLRHLALVAHYERVDLNSYSFAIRWQIKLLFHYKAVQWWCQSIEALYGTQRQVFAKRD